MGNAASKQFQLDVYGEIMDTLHLARVAGLEPEPEAWRIQVALLQFLESNWQQPDEGIWEVRDAIHTQVYVAGYDEQANTFVQSYGSPHLDASLLLMPQAGFLPPHDSRVRGTIKAIERTLLNRPSFHSVLNYRRKFKQRSMEFLDDAR